MSFSRSKLHPSKNWSPSRSLGLLRDNAYGTPENLAAKIVFGGHPLAVWIQSEEGSLEGDDIGAKLGLTASEFSHHLYDWDGIFTYLNPQSILTYCKEIGVHPAHMVPFDSNPRLSLPANLLLANILILKDGDFTAEDKGLAQRSIISENQRFARFVQERKIDDCLASDKSFDGDKIFRLVDEFVVSQAGGFVEIVPQMPANSPLSRNEMSVIEGSRNALSLLFEKSIVARDRQNQAKRNRLRDENDALKIEEKRVQDAYLKLFSGVVPDIGTAAASFAKALSDRNAMLSHGEKLNRSADCSKVRSFLMQVERSSFARLHDAINQGKFDAAGQDIETRIECQVNELVKASADMIYASKSRFEAFTSYTLDKKSHEPDIRRNQEMQHLIESGPLSYVSRLVANQHMICWMDRSYRPHDSMKCAL